MMPDPHEIYTELLLDHARRPRHQCPLSRFDGFADGYNPLCGDRIKVWLKIGDAAVQDVSFEGEGCAISTASASMMTEALRNLPLPEARRLIDRFLRQATGRDPADHDETPLDESLLSLTTVGRLPARVKCATLAWHAARKALEQAVAADTIDTDHQS